MVCLGTVRLLSRDMVSELWESPMCEVVFQPSGKRILVRQGSRLLKTVLGVGLPIGYACRGLGLCVACAVWARGELSEICASEAALLSRMEKSRQRADFNLRIACLARIRGRVEVYADYWGPYIP